MWRGRPAPARTQKPRSTRERGHPARSVLAIATRKAGRMPALPDILKAGSEVPPLL